MSVDALHSARKHCNNVERDEHHVEHRVAEDVIAEAVRSHLLDLLDFRLTGTFFIKVITSYVIERFSLFVCLHSVVLINR